MPRINFSDCTCNGRIMGGSNLTQTGTQFTVVCKRCDRAFDVIRNFGGGIRLMKDERVNPAKCPSCGSMALELY